jgi:polyferredoxin
MKGAIHGKTHFRFLKDPALAKSEKSSQGIRKRTRTQGVTNMANRKKETGKAQKIRLWIQIAFFAFVAIVATANGLKESGIDIPLGGEASLHAICPFGGVVSFWNLATLGTLVKKVHESSLVLAVIGILLAILFGPVLCGWVCPFGSFQEWIGAIGRKMFPKRYNAFAPQKMDSALRFLRYAVLAWVSYMTVMTGKLAFQEVDPYYALFNFWRSEVSIGGFIVLGATIALSLFVERPFCKYACPYGAFQGLFNFFRVFKIRRNSATCISCAACSRACPMNIDVAKSGVVRDHQCVSCLKCTSESACPVASTVEFSAARPAFTLGAAGLAAATVLVLFGGIGVSALIGVWKISSTKEPAAIRSGEFVGMPNPSDIRGSYTWDDVSAAFGIPVAILTEAFDAAEGSGKVNELESVWAGKAPAGKEIGTDSVRLFVALYTGLPHTPEESTALPDSAIAVLERAGKDSLSRPAITEPSKSAAPAVKEQASPAQNAPAEPAPVEPVAPSISITGKMTFRELEAAGIPKEKMTEVLGPIANMDEGVKTFCERNGLEFGDVKAKLLEP